MKRNAAFNIVVTLNKDTEKWSVEIPSESGGDFKYIWTAGSPVQALLDMIHDWGNIGLEDHALTKAVLDEEKEGLT